MDSGVRIGVDVGTVRVGVAASDPSGVMAFPLTAVARTPQSAHEVLAIAAEREAVALFVGLPLHMNGTEGASAQDARAFAQELAELTDIPVRLVDERLTTTQASRAMSQAGRSAKDQRARIDAAAATILLENALDIDRRGNLDTVTIGVFRKETH